MKNFAFLTCILWLSVGARAQSALHPQIDERVEFLNIVYQLARYGQATEAGNPDYTKAINRHFLPYGGHKAIAYTKDLIGKYWQDSIDIKDWELPSLAVHIASLRDFKPLTGAYRDSTDGWDDRTLLSPEYLQLLQSFYRDSRAKTFFKARKKYYAQVGRYFLEKGTPVDGSWIQRFFSTPKTETYYPILSLSPAGGAYIRANLDPVRRNTHTVFGSSGYDAAGRPLDVDNPYFAWAILHETIHCYSNQLVEQNAAKFRAIGEALLTNKTVLEKTKNTFYGNWRYLIYESMVRSVSIRYAMAHHTAPAKTEEDIKKQESLGFLWMRDLVDLLGKYESNRTQYRDLSAFMPEIVAAFEGYAQKYAGK